MFRGGRGLFASMFWVVSGACGYSNGEVCVWDDGIEGCNIGIGPVCVVRLGRCVFYWRLGCLSFVVGQVVS